jgi:hypothetical protein
MGAAKTRGYLARISANSGKLFLLVFDADSATQERDTLQKIAAKFRVGGRSGADVTRQMR